MSNLSDVRECLMDTMNKLKEGKMDVKQAKGVAELGKVLIESAKAEVEFIKATGSYRSSSGFIDLPKKDKFSEIANIDR